jgi:hypothetical protein
MEGFKSVVKGEDVRRGLGCVSLVRSNWGNLLAGPDVSIDIMERSTSSFTRSTFMARIEELDEGLVGAKFRRYAAGRSPPNDEQTLEKMCIISINLQS